MSTCWIPLFICCCLTITPFIPDAQAIFAPRSANGEYSLRLQYLVRQCMPLCANDGQLYVPDRLWKKCRCVCPRGYAGIACERRVEERKRSYQTQITGEILEPPKLNSASVQLYPEEAVFTNEYSQWNKHFQNHIPSENEDH
ncbi:hypothetical protein FGIG_03503 [Fasciola gigantica]|uniref:EGF-like domain-containing protein n=1 Tax=Fasciola gigantica TaxID=46835 RepID=A0A504Z4U1_FASGI|nr:hypothetical protein FGIG_03503 [Fasciola gigantica]